MPIELSPIKIKRTDDRIGGGSIDVPKPFNIGEVMPHIFPHQSPDGKMHKGNMKVIEVSGSLGLLATVECVMPNCDTQMTVKGIFDE